MYRKTNQLIIFFTIVLLIVSTNTIAKVQIVSSSDLEPQSKHVKAIKLITHILTTYHYKKTNLDDALSSSIYTHYLDSLDRNKAYFIMSDIKAFEPYRLGIDDAIMKSDLTLAYTIFKRYRHRVDERIKFALKTLDQQFDFTIDEYYRFDRRDDDWAEDSKALDEIWRKRVKNDFLSLRLTDKSDAEIKKTLTARYQRIRTSTFQLTSNDVFQSFMNAYTTSVEPHTTYFSPRISENFDISMRLSLEGIGAILRSENDYTQIVRVITGGPADLSGQIKADDRIIGVGQGEKGEIIDVIGWRLDDVVEQIRGPKASIIKLEVLPEGSEGPAKIVMLTRDKIKLEEQAASSSVIDVPKSNSKIGVITLPTFYVDFVAQAEGKKDYKSTSRDVRHLIQQMQEKENIDGLIVDLRNNGGGSLSEALQLTGLFIDEGPVVQTKDASGRVNINYDPEPGVSYGGPLAVLVNRNSASASEIFAGAIQDYHRGIVIGEPTFGKGTVQNLVDLNQFSRKNSDENYGRLKTTIAQFFRVSGGSNQHKGVVPDIVFPTADDTLDQGERAYDNALPWSKVNAAKYSPAAAPVERFAMAKKAHEKRIETNNLFQLLLDDIQLQRQVSQRKDISLLQIKRKAEREKVLMAKKNIQNAMRVEKGLPPLADGEKIDLEQNTENDEKDGQIDILLNETAEILNDLIKPSERNAVDTRMVKSEHQY